MAISAVPDTGHGATVTFGTTSWSGKLIGIPTNVHETREPVSTVYLGTTSAETFMSGDVPKQGRVEFDVQFDSVNGLPATTTSTETITITFPLPGGSAAVAGNIAFSGLIVERVYPPLQTGVLQQGKIVVQPSGNITWTAAT
jgi:hypothetical protein